MAASLQALWDFPWVSFLWFGFFFERGPSSESDFLQVCSSYRQARLGASGLGAQAWVLPTLMLAYVESLVPSVGAGTGFISLSFPTRQCSLPAKSLEIPKRN